MKNTIVVDAIADTAANDADGESESSDGSDQVVRADDGGCAESQSINSIEW